MRQGFLGAVKGKTVLAHAVEGQQQSVFTPVGTERAAHARRFLRSVAMAVVLGAGSVGFAAPAWAANSQAEHSPKHTQNKPEKAHPTRLAQAQSLGAAPVMKAVQHGVSSTSLHQAAQAWTDMPNSLREAYSARDWKPLWLTGAADQAERLSSLTKALDQASDHGVVLPPIKGSLTDAPEMYELSLSRAAALLARALSHGALTSPPDDAERPASPSDKALLDQLSHAPQPGAAILARAPHTPLYRQTMAALGESRKIAATAQWPKIPTEGKLSPGDDAAEVPLLRARLAASGAYHADEPTMASTVYDEDLQAAVKVFQDTHGLEPDGVVGRSTRAALNISPAERVDQLRVNLDRLRWLPDGLSERYLLVNIAGFEAWLFNKDAIELSTPVIVGKDQQRTPSFSNSIKSVEFNPSWEVPRSIAVNEILPRQAKDHSYLAKENMEVYEGWDGGGQLVNPDSVDWASLAKSERLPYRFRQKPGPKNSLGRVKLLFPNSHDVYLHDTPSRGLFNRRVRAFSHGCMRVGKPLELSAAVLGMPLERVKEIVDGGKQTRIKVAAPLPIHITYLTSWADPISGQMRYGSDVYGRDAALIAQLHAPGKTSDTDPDPMIEKVRAAVVAKTADPAATPVQVIPAAVPAEESVPASAPPVQEAPAPEATPQTDGAPQPAPEIKAERPTDVPVQSAGVSGNEAVQGTVVSQGDAAPKNPE